MITENEIFSNQSPVKNQIVSIKYERKIHSSLKREGISLKYIRPRDLSIIQINNGYDPD